MEIERNVRTDIERFVKVAGGEVFDVPTNPSGPWPTDMIVLVEEEPDLSKALDWPVFEFGTIDDAPGAADKVRAELVKSVKRYITKQGGPHGILRWRKYPRSDKLWGGGFTARCRLAFQIS